MKKSKRKDFSPMPFGHGDVPPSLFVQMEGRGLVLRANHPPNNRGIYCDSLEPRGC